MKNSWIIILTAIAFISLEGCSATTPSIVNEQSLLGDWTITYILDAPVIDHSPAEISFLQNKKVAGNGSCNRIMSSYQVSPETNKLSFGQNASTMMMCPPVLMEQENKLFTAMPKVSNAHFEEGILVLTDSNLRMIIQAKRK